MSAFMYSMRKENYFAFTRKKESVRTIQERQFNDLINQLRQAFEEASAKASTSVVSIIAEQEDQIKPFSFRSEFFVDVKIKDAFLFEIIRSSFDVYD
ncbi:MAG: hypothetical protein ACOC5R_03900 [Elusimicrobiota bacterium]